MNWCSLQPKVEKLYTVSKNQTWSWLWLRSWAHYCKIQTYIEESMGYFLKTLWRLYEESMGHSVQFSSVQSLSHIRLFVTPWIAARQASLSITNSWSSLRLKSIELVMAFSHLILCRPLLLLPTIPPSIRLFSSESTLRMRWPRYWSFSFSIIPSKEIPGLISFRTDWLISLQSKGLSRVFSNTTVQKLTMGHSSMT